MDSVELVKSICKERGIPISKLERDLDFANGYIRKLKEGKFPSDRLQKIADYLDVSVPYLIGTKENESAVDPNTIENVYLSYAKTMQENNISPDDIRLAIETIMKLRGNQ